MWNGNSPWNLRADSPGNAVDPLSAEYVGYLVGAIRDKGVGFGGGDAVPFYRVPDNTPLTPVDVGAHWLPMLVAKFAEGVPLPANAEAFPNRDANLVIRRGNEVWETFGFNRADDGTCTAKFAGYKRNVRLDPGFYYNGYDPAITASTVQTSQFEWGVSASGLPCYAGMIRKSEIQALCIQHTLAMFVPHARLGAHVWPAQREDGSTHDQYATLEGSCFRLRPDLDLRDYNLPPDALAVATTCQKWGYRVTDQSLDATFVRSEEGCQEFFTMGHAALIPWEESELLLMDVRTGPDKTWLPEPA